MRTRAGGKTKGALRRCGTCLAEFREQPGGAWRLEYVSPDLFHAPRGADVPRVPLWEVRSWDLWAAPASTAPSPETVPVPTDARAPGMEPGEVLRQAFAPARVVTPHTHNPRQGFDEAGVVWLTDRALRVRAGSFEWASPLTEIRGARDAAGVVEVLAGPTDEPLHLLLGDPRRFLDALGPLLTKRSP